MIAAVLSKSLNTCIMVHFYFVVMDLTKDREDPAQMWFTYANCNEDLTRFVRQIAERNGTAFEKMRLHMYETKKAWEGARDAFVKRADWSRA